MAVFPDQTVFTKKNQKKIFQKVGVTHRKKTIDRLIGTGGLKRGPGQERSMFQKKGDEGGKKRRRKMRPLLLQE